MSGNPISNTKRDQKKLEHDLNINVLPDNETASDQLQSPTNSHVDSGIVSQDDEEHVVKNGSCQ